MLFHQIPYNNQIYIIHIHQLVYMCHILNHIKYKMLILKSIHLYKKYNHLQLIQYIKDTELHNLYIILHVLCIKLNNYIQGQHIFFQV